jgi:pSer/pThr/pTyr-binding forkhead associated (FHA) protein
VEQSSTDELTVRELVRRAARISRESFVAQLGPYVFIGPSTPQPTNQAWSFETRHGAAKGETNPLHTLLASVAYPVRKKKADRAVFESTVLIGRTDSNDICIRDPSVSKLHARISTKDLTLTDAGSSNGTFVDEVRLGPSDAIPLKVNQHLRFGDRSFTVYSTSGLYGVLKHLK